MLELLHHHHHHAGSTNALSGPLAWKVLFQRRRRNSPCRDMGIKLAFNGCAHCTRSLSTLRISSPVHSYTTLLPYQPPYRRAWQAVFAILFHFHPSIVHHNNNNIISSKRTCETPNIAVTRNAKISISESNRQSVCLFVVNPTTSNRTRRRRRRSWWSSRRPHAIKYRRRGQSFPWTMSYSLQHQKYFCCWFTVPESKNMVARVVSLRLITKLCTERE